MTFIISLYVAVWIAATSLIQAAFAAAFALKLFRARQSNSTSYCPKTAVVLALRGSDPNLLANMTAVLGQDYPDFTLFVIVDSPQDAAWKVL